MTGSGDNAVGNVHSADCGTDEYAPLSPIRSDVELLRAIADGDKDALGVLYHRFAARLLGVARRLLSNPEDAEDIVHDVFIEVWRRAADYDHSRGTVGAWLLVRTRSRALDRLKSPSQRRHDSFDVDLLRDDDAFSEMNELAIESWDPASYLDGAQVWTALEDLAVEQRVVVELAYFEGMTLIEVGNCLGIPEGTVKSRLSRAVAALRERFNRAVSRTGM